MLTFLNTFRNYHTERVNIEMQNTQPKYNTQSLQTIMGRKLDLNDGNTYIRIY